MAYKPKVLELAAGGTNASLTASNGGILYSTASAGAILSGTATAGQVLTSGSNTAPSWSSPSSIGSSLVLISSQAASASANISFTGLSTYINYLLIWRSAFAATNTDFLELLVSTNNGSTYQNTGYTGGVNYHAFNSTLNTNANSTTYFPLSGPCSNATNNSGFLHLNDINSGDVVAISGAVTYSDSTLGTVAFGNIGGKSGQTAVNAIRIQYSTGNISTGTFDLYAFRES